MKNIFIILAFLSIATELIYSQSWYEQTVNVPSNSLVSFSVADENTCWAFWSTSYASNNQFKNGIIRTTDGGETWSGGEIPEIETGINMWIEALDVNTVYLTVENWAGRGVQGIYKTTDGGINWVRNNTAYADSPLGPAYIHFFDKNNGVVVGEKNKGQGFEIYTTTDGGSNWDAVPQSNIPSAFTNEFVQTTPMGEYKDNIWLTTIPPNGHGPRIFKTTDRGYHWTVIEPPGLTEQYLISVAFQDESNGLMVQFTYNKGKILRTTDGGSTWTEISSPNGLTPNFIVHIPGTASDYLLANDANFVGGPGGSAFTRDGGDTWNIIDNKNHIAPCFYSDSVGWSSSFASNTIFKFTGKITAVWDKTENEKINSYSLSQNYPNPFNPSTTIKYEIKKRSNVKIILLNAIGEKVSTLLNEEKAPGQYQVQFNASSLPSGVYFYRIEAGNYTSAKKMLLLK